MFRTRVANLTGRIQDEYRGHRLKSIARELYFRGSARFTPTLEAEWGGKRFLMRTYDRAVGLHVFVAGPTEHGTLEAVVRLLRDRESQNDPEDKVFLEVGGNIGTTSVIALSDLGFSRLECFEPLPDNFDLLTANLELNGLADRARVHQIALAESAGEVEFEISPENSGDGRIRLGEPDGGAFSEAQRDVVKVRTSAFDSFVRSGEIDLTAIGVAWIDAQGSEGAILEGAKTLLESDIPVVVEYWPYGLKRANGERSFFELIKEYYTTVIDLKVPENPVEYDASEIDRISPLYGQASFTDPEAVNSSTDLLLIKE